MSDLKQVGTPADIGQAMDAVLGHNKWRGGIEDLTYSDIEKVAGGRVLTEKDIQNIVNTVMSRIPKSPAVANVQSQQQEQISKAKIMQLVGEGYVTPNQLSQALNKIAKDNSLEDTAAKGFLFNVNGNDIRFACDGIKRDIISNRAIAATYYMTTGGSVGKDALHWHLSEDEKHLDSNKFFVSSIDNEKVYMDAQTLVDLCNAMTSFLESI